MIKVTESAMAEICGKLSINPKCLEFLGGGRGDSDGIVYTYNSGSGKMVLKILAIPENQIDRLHSLEVRVRYANYLGENGIKIAYPIKNQNGNLYETSIDNQHVYTAYIMEFCGGRNPESHELTDEMVQEWGRIIGKSHKVTKNFSEGKDSGNFSYKEEMSFFMNWCKEPIVKSAWSDMECYLDTLPKGQDDYGFIHNDNHQRNILVLDKDITIIDFDCAGRQFFVQDITTAAQGIMFEITGGMLSPLSDAKRLKRFFDSFINGYEKENHLADFWYKELATFINYRRLLLFTCMQDWLNTRADLKNSFIENIKNPPQILF
jgi:Ser/Thr protein kinase RdoA (MazF antagonist)